MSIARSFACRRVPARLATGLALLAVGGARLGSGDEPGALDVSRGPVAHQVLQRDASGAADVEIAGTAAAALSGTVRVTVRAGGKALATFRDRAAGEAAAGKWSASIRRLPTGGPYRIELALRDRAGLVAARAAIDDLLVGDLWLLAGQSNMQGVGRLAGVTPAHPLVHSFDLGDRWGVATEPLHRLLEAVDPVYWGRRYPSREERDRDAAAARSAETKGAGLGLPFAVELATRTGVPIGLVPCALGGTAIARWDPALGDQGGASLYGALRRRLRAVGGRVTGMLWYQGEADARQPEAAPVYGERLRSFIAAVRRDCGRERLPFYLVQLGRMLEWIYYPDPARRPPALDAQWSTVREAERRLVAELPGVGMVPAADLELEDSIHLDTANLKRVGRRLARLARREVYGERQLEPAIAVGAIEHDPAAEEIRVRFTGVHGRLRAAGRIVGFGLRRPDGSEVAAIFAAAVDAADPSAVVLRYQARLPERIGLVYGWGVNPVCNLVDDADMAPPCFGPIELPARGAVAFGAAGARP